jgi:hypothetical protein
MIDLLNEGLAGLADMISSPLFVSLIHDVIIASLGLVGALFGGRYALRAAMHSTLEQRRSERIRWEREEVLKLGAEVLDYSRQKWDRVWAFKIFSLNPDPARKTIASEELDRLSPLTTIEANRLRFLEAQARVLGQPVLANLVSQLYGAGKFDMPIEEMTIEQFDEKTSEIMRNRWSLVEELARVLKAE